jgi:leukotriene A-4 hydrolase/aminopeptidase
MQSSCCNFYFLLLGIFISTACSNSKDKIDKTMNGEVFQDVHSFARPAEAIIRHLDWEAEVDFVKQRIKGKASWEISAFSDASELVLDTKGLKITKVTLGEPEKEASWKLATEQEKEHLGTPLIINITPETRLVHVYYNTSEQSEALQWLEPVQTAGKQKPFLFTQSQAILARTWLPVQDSPGIRFTYNARVKVPADLLALMSAENPQQKNADGVYQFRMDQPIPAYLFALSVGDLEFREVGNRTGVYAEPSLIEKSAWEFAEMEDMLNAAEKLYGPYRWERYDLIVLPPSFPFGGMENPRLTFATPTILAGDRSLTSLVAHELAHSWSGNLVTNDTWNDFWLNEGFTVYFERRIMEELYGESYSEMLAELGQFDLKSTVKRLTEKGEAEDTRLKLDLEGRNPDDGVTDVAYEKGYFFLKILEQQVGRNNFDQFLRQYFDRFAFQSMNTSNFIDYLKKEFNESFGVSLNQNLIDRWIFQPGLPESMPQVNSTRFDQVEAALKSWEEGTSLEKLDTTDWSSHEWLHFIRNLPENISPEKISELDQVFGFSETGNSEMLAAWLLYSVNHNYEAAYQSLEKFLESVGRRKFLVPLYEALAETGEGKAMDLKIYRRARPNYHFVSVNTIDSILEWDQNM